MGHIPLTKPEGRLVAELAIFLSVQPPGSIPQECLGHISLGDSLNLSSLGKVLFFQEQRLKVGTRKEISVPESEVIIG